MLIAKPVPHQMVRDSVEIRGSVLDNDLLALRSDIVLRIAMTSKVTLIDLSVFGAIEDSPPLL